jgi:hypothetical protein
MTTITNPTWNKATAQLGGAVPLVPCNASVDSAGADTGDMCSHGGCTEFWRSHPDDPWPPGPNASHPVRAVLAAAGDYPVNTWDITPTDPGYGGPNLTLHSRRGEVWVATAQMIGMEFPPASWVLLPVGLLQYVDTECIRANGDRDAAKAYNSALAGAFPDGLPGGCGGYIDMDGLLTDA